MKKRIYVLLWVAVMSFDINVLGFWAFERASNPDIRGLFDVVWWWVVTSTTLGYGDIVPVTWQGRLVSMVAIVMGFFIYTNFVAIIAESIHGLLERKNLGRVQVRARSHVVLCEYTAIADELIQGISSCEELKDRELVIVSNLVPSNPYPQHHFVNGVPINPAALCQANIQHADYVFIFANLRFADPDVKTLHIASRVLDLNDKARVFVEMIDPNNGLLKYSSRKLHVMDSRSLFESVLRDRNLDVSELISRGDR